MNTKILSFTERGYRLALRIAGETGGTASRCEEGGLAAWTELAFASAEAIVYVGACGIAVRAISPFVRHKAEDPAVLVVDECGQFVIPILSGHLGGANALARHLAEALGALPVITTATDGRGLFAVDVWAKAQGCALPEPGGIKRVSAKLLRGEKVFFCSEFPIAGERPENVFPSAGEKADFALTIRRVPEETLACVPRIAALGVGCRKGIEQEALEGQLQAFLEKHGLQESAIRCVCTIDRKSGEPGLLAFCDAHGWELRSFSAGELNALPGSFSSSDFVEKTVGTDNVCERSAVLGSKGKLIAGKYAGNGATFAAAIAPYFPKWRECQ